MKTFLQLHETLRNDLLGYDPVPSPNDMVKANIEKPLLRALQSVEFLKTLNPKEKQFALNVFKTFLGL